MTVGYSLVIVYPDTKVLQPVLRNLHPLQHIRTNPINETRNMATVSSAFKRPKISLLLTHREVSHEYKLNQNRLVYAMQGSGPHEPSLFEVAKLLYT